jgi:hypothetical protein
MTLRRANIQYKWIFGTPWQGRADLAPAVISRPTAEWQASTSVGRSAIGQCGDTVYVGADGVFLQARMEP